MNVPMVVGAGLLAGATTCAVTQGGLLVGLIARQRKAAGATGAGSSVARDVAPVAAFLAGKLVSHTAAGLVLGALGGAFGFNARMGAAAQLVAGLAIVVLGLSALEVPGLRALHFTPPESWLGVVRRTTRSSSSAAPFVLGMAVLAVPCGVTISMELLAASSGSALAGGAIMGLFVLGTAPMFTVYGYLSQRLSFTRAWSTALGALVVAFGLITLNAGLVAAGSPVTMQALLRAETATGPAAASSSSQSTSPVASSSTASPAPGGQNIAIVANNSGYLPRDVQAMSGIPITLSFTTHNVLSCIRATTLPTLGKQLLLPQDGTGVLELGALAPGDYPITCSMGMYTATLHVSG